MIHVYYGDGKGKTTAAVGLAVRFAYSGSCAVVQFLKDGSSSEVRLLEKLSLPQLVCMYSEQVHGFYQTLSDNEKSAVKTEVDGLLAKAQTLLSEGCGLVVMDEIIDCVRLGIISESAITELLEKHKGRAEIVLTGHTLPEWAEKAADYCTQMRCVKHPYNTRNAPARRGIEF